MAEKYLDKRILFVTSSLSNYRFVWNGTLGCKAARKMGCEFRLVGRRVCVVAERYDVTDKTFELIFYNESTPNQRKVFTHLDTVNNIVACAGKSFLKVKMKTDYIRHNNSTVILLADVYEDYPKIKTPEYVKPSTLVNIVNYSEIMMSETPEPLTTTVKVLNESGTHFQRVTRNMADKRINKKTFSLLYPFTEYRFVWNGTLRCRAARKKGCGFSLMPYGDRACVVAERYDVTDNTFNLIFYNESTPKQRKIFTQSDTRDSVYACGGENAILNVKMKTKYTRNNNSTVILEAGLMLMYRFDHRTKTSEYSKTSTPMTLFTETAADLSDDEDPNGRVLVAILFSIIIVVAVCGMTIYCVRRIQQRKHQSKESDDTIPLQPKAHPAQVLSPPPTENPKLTPLPEEHPGLV